VGHESTGPEEISAHAGLSDGVFFFLVDFADLKSGHAGEERREKHEAQQPRRLTSIDQLLKSFQVRPAIHEKYSVASRDRASEAWRVFEVAGGNFDAISPLRYLARVAYEHAHPLPAGQQLFD